MRLLPSFHLKKLQKHKRHQYHHHIHKLVHHLHHKHNISRKTLFYVKEYGQHSNVAKTIIKESIKVLILASVISSLGGLALERVKFLFVSLVPLIIMFPALNDMIGDYGTIFASRFSTMLHEGKIRGAWWKHRELKELFFQVLLISLLTTSLSLGLSFLAAQFSSHQVDFMHGLKIFIAVFLDALLLVILLFFISVAGGLYFYHKKEDPNNLLIPLVTSVADFGNIVILSLLIVTLF